MYSIFSDGVCIHSDMFLEKDNKVLTPRWRMKDNSAGSLSFVLPKQNVHYNDVKRLSSVIQLKRDNVLVWEGRIIEDNIDFWNQRHITCEGALAYLNDTTQPPGRYQNITIYNFLKQLIDRHNERVGPEKRFEMGAVTVHDTNDSIYKYTNNESTWECIETKLVEVFGGHVRVRYQDGRRLIDYLAEYPKTSTQTVQFRSNLLDFTRNFDLSKVATVVMPRGARLEEPEIEGLESYLDVKSVNGGSPYVTSEEAIAQFGWIEKVVDWDNVTLPENLLKKAKDYLEDVQFEQMVIEANLFDLRLINPELESIDLLDDVRCISTPHGMDRIFPVTSIDIPLDDPGHATYIFGESYDVTLSGTLVKSKRDQKKTNSDIYTTVDNVKSDLNEKIDENYVVIDKKIKSVEESLIETNKYISEEAMRILKEAKDNATEQIKMASNGFITITKDPNGTQELYITDALDYTAASKLWRWNLNGLGYSNDGGETFGLAITMDGSIVADYITAGTMSANRVRTGSLVSANGNTAWNLDTGELTMRTGSINLGNKFTVNNSGYMTAVSGNIAGFEISPTSISNGHIYLGPDGFRILRNNSNSFFIGLNDVEGYPDELFVDLMTQDPSVYGVSISVNRQIFAFFAGKKKSGVTSAPNEISIFKPVHMYQPLDMHGWGIKNAGGATGTMNFVQIAGVNSNGTISSWYNNCNMTFEGGLLKSGRFNP